MDALKLTLNEIERAGSSIAEKKTLVGFDGFVDKIVQPVDKRHGLGEAYTPISTIDAFGSRISAAAGKSTNIELYPKLEKLGGNGPIMANALLAAGCQTHYIGALGDPTIHPVFAEFATRTEAISLCDPGITHAVEFTDGKIMLGTMASLDNITFETLQAKCGPHNLIEAFASRDLISLINWTMVPHMSEVLEAFIDELLPKLPINPERRFFFDLCDPQKRSDEAVKRVLKAIDKFNDFSKTTLGLNFKESHEISRVLGLPCLDDDEAGLCQMAVNIREALTIDTVMIHPVHAAACATPEGTAWVPGPYCQSPKITTGAGDHCNAGFCTAQILGFAPEACLVLGVSTSGYYVRTAESPSLEALQGFISQWLKDGEVA